MDSHTSDRGPFFKKSEIQAWHVCFITKVHKIRKNTLTFILRLSPVWSPASRCAFTPNLLASVQRTSGVFARLLCFLHAGVKSVVQAEPAHKDKGAFWFTSKQTVVHL